MALTMVLSKGFDQEQKNRLERIITLNSTKATACGLDSARNDVL